MDSTAINTIPYSSCQALAAKPTKAYTQAQDVKLDIQAKSGRPANTDSNLNKLVASSISASGIINRETIDLLAQIKEGLTKEGLMLEVDRLAVPDAPPTVGAGPAPAPEADRPAATDDVPPPAAEVDNRLAVPNNVPPAVESGPADLDNNTLYPAT